MLVIALGAIDFFAALLLIIGGAGIPGPDIFKGIIIALLLIKAFISVVPVPIFLPNLLMCATDFLAALLIFFGGAAIPFPDGFEMGLIILLLLKGTLAILSSTAEIIG